MSDKNKTLEEIVQASCALAGEIEDHALEGNEMVICVCAMSLLLHKTSKQNMLSALAASTEGGERGEHSIQAAMAFAEMEKVCKKMLLHFPGAIVGDGFKKQALKVFKDNSLFSKDSDEEAVSVPTEKDMNVLMDQLFNGDSKDDS